MHTFAFDAIGTRFRIDSEAVLGDALRAAVLAECERFDRAWSRFRADSMVVELRRTGRATAPDDASLMLDELAAARTATRGAVNPFVGGSLEALGYDAAYSLTAGEARPAPTSAVRIVGGELLHDGPPATLDVGSLGKGRLVDRLAGLVDAAVPGAATIDGSGDIRVSGHAERIALEHPYDASRAIGVWRVTDAALCASAITRRAWGDGLHHVLDARTGLPVKRIAATWALAPDAMRADLAATALFFDGGAEYAASRGIEWVCMSVDGRVERSAGCDAELFTAAPATAAPAPASRDSVMGWLS